MYTCYNYITYSFKIKTLISLPDLSFPDIISSLNLSTILTVIFGPKSETNNACKLKFPFSVKREGDQRWWWFKRNLFKLIENSVCFGEVPEEEELVDDC